MKANTDKDIMIMITVIKIAHTNTNKKKNICLLLFFIIKLYLEFIKIYFSYVNQYTYSSPTNR
uniref:Uncharacterized protein n=1 Tax=Phlebia radiata TaxID=5308 RepID=L8B9C2_PHLRA|nr:hypothetical protein PRA_mt0017 [Phlebia radiata]CCE89165.1 hypothetical protein PRA_mt0017 [Phlebia radiata]